MQVLTAKLETIAKETGDHKEGSSSAAQKGGDEFQRLKAKIAAELKDVRDKLKQRDELMQKGASGTKATVHVAQQIRVQIKQAREDANRLMAIQRREATRTRGKEKKVEEAEKRQQIVELVFQHLEEVESQDKKRYASKNTEARVELFATGGKIALSNVVASSSRSGGAGPSSGGGDGYGGTELPEIDAETTQGLQQLERKNEQIDEQLEIVAEGIGELKDIALNMRDQVKVHGAMVGEITTKVELASSHLNTINKKMKTTLARTRSADRFILDFILIVIILGIVGYIISMVM